MYLFVFILANVLNLALLAKGRLITCVCTTTHCQEQQTRTCNTTSMCFSQYLDRRDGSDPVIKGCITSKTPLLCENRRPAVHHASWPVLLCCNTNMCNLDVQPTPAGTDKGSKFASTTTTTSMLPELKIEDSSETGTSGKGQPTGSGHSSNIVFIALIIAGILCLFVIAGIAILVLRRQSVLYNEEFGAVQRNGYLKGHSTEVSVADIHRTTPIVLGKTYDNKLVLST